MSVPYNIFIDITSVCAVCLVQPDNEEHQPFVDITSRLIEDPELKTRLLELGINFPLDDFNSKVICKSCVESQGSWSKTKQKAIKGHIIKDYIIKNKISGVSMPGTSKATSSSLMLRNNEESSRETPFKNSQLPLKRSNKFGDSMPGTSNTSTQSMTLRNNEESSQEPPFKHSRLPLQRSNTFGDSMPGSSKATSSSSMLRNNEESSRETPFKNSQLPSNPSNKFGDAMPGTSKASTPSLMLRNNVESSRETPFKNSQLPSNNRSNTFGDSMPGSSKATSSSSMLRNNEESSRETPFKNSQLPSNPSNKFGDAMPGTSKASTPSLVLRNNVESSRETPFKNSQLPSNRSNKFGDSMPGTSNTSTQSMTLRNNEESSQKALFKPSKSMLKQSNNNETNLNECSSSNNEQGNSTRSLITNHSNSQFYDKSDDSCIIITAPIETIDLISDDEDSEDDNEIVDKTTELSQIEEVIIELSSDSEDNEDDLKTEYINNVTEKLYYCSICQKKKVLNHDCSQYTQSFFTCLVPSCNILSRSKKDFLFHYRPHIGMSSSEIMCRRCFKGIDQSNIDSNGYHIGCDTVNAFKCYSCNVKFSCIQELAYHNLKTHRGILMDTHYNYLCLYCKESNPDVLEITDHIKYCIENQEKNEKEASMKHKNPTDTETELLTVNINTMKNGMVRTDKNKKKIPLTSQHILFTCLKPSCNNVFQTFSNFKHHYRRHFELGSDFVCWQCCEPFTCKHDLKVHQIRNNCRTPGMYKCFQCSSNFDDIENLSIHKLTFHKGKLIASKKNKNSIMCAFCQMHIIIFNFETHLVTCKKKDDKETTCTTKKEDKKTICTTKNKSDYPCLTCKRVFTSSISLSRHSRIHKPSQISN